MVSILRIQSSYLYFFSVLTLKIQTCKYNLSTFKFIQCFYWPLIKDLKLWWVPPNIYGILSCILVLTYLIFKWLLLSYIVNDSLELFIFSLIIILSWYSELPSGITLPLPEGNHQNFFSYWGKLFGYFLFCFGYLTFEICFHW